MKRLTTTLAILALLAFGVTAFAFGPGMIGGTGLMMNGYGYGGMMGGMGPAMMGGYGMGTGMMGWNNPYTTNTQFSDFLNKTAKLRKQLQDKQFEYYEALRNPDTKKETLEKLQKEIFELQQKLYTQAPKGIQTGALAATPCWR